MTDSFLRRGCRCQDGACGPTDHAESLVQARMEPLSPEHVAIWLRTHAEARRAAGVEGWHLLLTAADALEREP